VRFRGRLGDFPWLEILVVIVLAAFTRSPALIALGAFGWYSSLRQDRRAGFLAALLGIHALGTMLLAVFPDAPIVPGGVEPKFNAHNTVSTVAYLPLVGTILVFNLISMKTAGRRAFSLFGLVVVGVNVPVPVITLVDAIDPICGLLQRIFYTLTCSWQAVASWQLLKRTRSGGEA